MKKLVAMLMAMTVSGSAQFLYNERLDKKSQDALTAAKAVVSSARLRIRMCIVSSAGSVRRPALCAVARHVSKSL